MVDSSADNPNPHRPKNPFDAKREPFTPRPLSEPDPNYIAGVPDNAPPTDQEALFRTAAIRCSEMESALSSQMRARIGDRSMVSVGQDTHLRSTGGIVDLFTSTESVSGTPNGQLEGKATINFIDGTHDFVDKLGIETDKALVIGGVYSDEKTRKEADEYIKNNPVNASNVNTTFYLNENGEHKKTVKRPKEMGIIPDRPIFLVIPNGYIYESEMTAEDFELVGIALQTLTNKLSPPEEKSTE